MRFGIKSRSVALGLAVILGLAGASQAALVGAIPSAPLFTYDTTDSILNYTAGSGVFEAEAVAVTFVQPPAVAVAPAPGDATARVKLSFLVANDGTIAGQINADDLVVTGEITIGSDVYSGELLKGRVVAFGFRDNDADGVTTDEFDFVLEVSGGALAGFYDGKNLAMSMTVENSTMSAGTLFTADFTGKPVKGVIGATPCETAIIGVVQCDETGQPIAGATVTVYDANNTEAGSAVTEADGSYMIPGLAGGATYSVSVTAPSTDYVSCDDVDTKSITLSCNSDNIVDFCLCVCNAEITGLVYCDKDGTIIPMPGITVTAYDVNNQVVGTAVSADDGTYTIVVPGPGAVDQTYSVEVDSAGYTSCDNIVSRTVTPTCGQQAEANFCLCQPQGCMQEICVKVVCVKDGVETPVKCVVVKLWNGCYFDWGKTDETGSKCFDGDKLKPGKYWVCIKPPCGYEISGPCCKEVCIAECEKKEVVFYACPKPTCEQAVNFSVVKKDCEGEGPAAGVVIKLWSYRTGLITKTTDDDGTAAFEGWSLKPGSYKAVVEIPNGYRSCDGKPTCFDFYLAPCEKKQFEFCIKPICDQKICVKVVKNVNGQIYPAKDVGVSIYRSCFNKCGKTGCDGQVCFSDGLKPGDYMVKINVPTGYELCDGEACKKVTLGQCCDSAEVEFCIKKKQETPKYDCTAKKHRTYRKTSCYTNKYSSWSWHR